MVRLSNPTDTEVIEAALRERGSLNGKDLFALLSRNRSASAIRAALEPLVQRGRVRFLLEYHKGPGRPTEWWEYVS